MKKCAVNNCLLGECKADCKFFHEKVGVNEERQAELAKECEKGGVRPFSSGTQCLDWRIRNCDRCSKFPPGLEPGEFLCEIDFCISYAAIASGTIPQSISDRMGIKHGHAPMSCKELTL